MLHTKTNNKIGSYTDVTDYRYHSKLQFDYRLTISTKLTEIGATRSRDKD